MLEKLNIENEPKLLKNFCQRFYILMSKSRGPRKYSTGVDGDEVTTITHRTTTTVRLGPVRFYYDTSKLSTPPPPTVAPLTTTTLLN